MRKRDDANFKKLKTYFKNRDDVLMAFLFGSQAKGYNTKRSDWDIGVYLKPKSGRLEWDTGELYPQRGEIWRELSEILHTDGVDLIVFNSSSATIADAAIRGIPLIIKDRKQFLNFMLAVSGEAEDYRQTIKEYADIYWRSKSLSQQDREMLDRRLIFLDSELRDIKKFRQLTQREYQNEKDKSKKRDAEHWVENIVIATVDIAKTVLASQKRAGADSYREIVEAGCSVLGLSEEVVKKFGEWVRLRNLLTHEYLDLRWKEIKAFIDEAPPYLEKFLKAAKKYLK